MRGASLEPSHLEVWTQSSTRETARAKTLFKFLLRKGVFSLEFIVVQVSVEVLGGGSQHFLTSPVLFCRKLINEFN